MQRALLLRIVPVVAVIAAARAQQPPIPAGLQQLMQEESMISKRWRVK
jgi:hypothetical protein